VLKSHNEDLGGKDFRKLPADIKNRILNYQFSVHVLPTETSDKEVIEIFARMNATGIRLNSQELRNAKYFREFKTSMYQTATKQYDRWIKWKVFDHHSIMRMKEAELVSELAILMDVGVSGKSQGSINRYYRKYDPEFPNRKEVERRFEVVFDTIDELLGDKLYRLKFSRTTLFYTLFAYIYDCLYGIESDLKAAKAKRLPKGFVAKITQISENFKKKDVPRDVLTAIERRTTHVDSRHKIFDYIKAF
jgi:hypothetical protein